MKVVSNKRRAALIQQLQDDIDDLMVKLAQHERHGRKQEAMATCLDIDNKDRWLDKMYEL